MRKIYRSMMLMTTHNFALNVLFVYILIVAVFFLYYLLYLAVLVVLPYSLYAYFHAVSISDIEHEINRTSTKSAASRNFLEKS